MGMIKVSGYSAMNGTLSFSAPKTTIRATGTKTQAYCNNFPLAALCGIAVVTALMTR